jgi:hypothetical protein
MSRPLSFRAYRSPQPGTRADPSGKRPVHKLVLNFEAEPVDRLLHATRLPGVRVGHVRTASAMPETIAPAFANLQSVRASRAPCAGDGPRETIEW